MKVLSWIFTVLSFLAIPVMFAVWGILKTEDTWWEILIIGIVLFAFFGLLAHVCIKGKFSDGEGGTKFLYYSSFPAFILLFVVYILFHFIIKAIKYVFRAISGKSSSSSGETVYVVYDDGFERCLRLYEKYKQDYDNPNLHYDRFVDDLGHYWRSYDKGDTFRKETLEETSRGY